MFATPTSCCQIWKLYRIIMWHNWSISLQSVGWFFYIAIFIWILRCPCSLHLSVILATIELMNMAIIHGYSNAYMDKLLWYLLSSPLSGNNKLRRSHYKAKKVIQKLGLSYDIIDYYPIGCMLYENEFAHLTGCPKPNCSKSCYIPSSKSIFIRILRHFPFISKLRHMFRSPIISKLLKWHSSNHLE